MLKTLMGEYPVTRQFLTRTMQTKCNTFGTVMAMDGPQGTITVR